MSLQAPCDENEWSIMKRARQARQRDARARVSAQQRRTAARMRTARNKVLVQELFARWTRAGVAVVLDAPHAAR